MNKKTKIVVIDDSAFMRKVISDIINDDFRCEVVAKANNGEEGLKIIEQFKPDVVTLDIQMPIMNGLEMLKNMVKTKFIPVIMMSSLTKEGAKETIEALELGAVDFITKPRNIFSINSEQMKQELINKILVAARIPSHKINSKNYRYNNIKLFANKEIIKNKDINKLDEKVNNLIAVGTSTGGPKALQKLIPKIPKNINGSILIVQHMPPGFTKSLANRLNQLSEIIVKEAEDGEILKNGVAYISPGDSHMKIIKKSTNTYIIKLTSEEPVGGHRPAVNVLFNSVSEVFTKSIVGVILTGMGSDGCKGMCALKEYNDAYVIAQDEDSCVVYGMPKAVVDKGIADEVISIEKIYTSIIKKAGVI